MGDFVTTFLAMSPVYTLCQYGTVDPNPFTVTSLILIWKKIIRNIPYFFIFLFVELPPANHFSFIFWSNLFVIFLFVEIGGKDKDILICHLQWILFILLL